MKLKEFFNTVPVHGYIKLTVLNDECNPLEEIEPRFWCDDVMQSELTEYEDCGIYDITVSGGKLNIKVISNDRIVKRSGEWLYYSQSGKEYEIVEMIVPNSDTTYDIAMLLYNRAPECELPEYDVAGWFFGITTMDERELLCDCRYYAKRYELKNIF